MQAPDVENGMWALKPDEARAIVGVFEGMKELLIRARDMLHHTKCRDEDATACPACSLESEIDLFLLRTPKPGKPV